ncbi:MAG: hypothetical protein EOP45_16535 [Sphingobacteriaceae bacterium]|nr:MAG: hypothetical protein EOP45_16535 [Sphingobacteriaceae bacterium]
MQKIEELQNVINDHNQKPQKSNSLDGVSIRTTKSNLYTSPSEQQDETTVDSSTSINNVPKMLDSDYNKSLSPLQSRALWKLGVEQQKAKSNRRSIGWKAHVYPRTDLFEGEPMGSIIESIGGPSLDDKARARKLNYHTKLMSSWKSEEEIEAFLAQTRETACTYKRQRSEMC